MKSRNNTPPQVSSSRVDWRRKRTPPWQLLALVRQATKRRPTRQQIAIGFGRSMQFMAAIRHRAHAPFRSSAPGPEYQPQPIHPPILSRL